MGIGDGLVHVVVGRHADGAAGAGDERDVFRQDLPQAGTEDRDRMRAADLHVAERPADRGSQTPNLGDKLLRGFALFRFRQRFCLRRFVRCNVCPNRCRIRRLRLLRTHDNASTVRGAPSISLSSAYVSSASFSSTFCMAKPAWTST